MRKNILLVDTDKDKDRGKNKMIDFVLMSENNCLELIFNVNSRRNWGWKMLGVNKEEISKKALLKKKIEIIEEY